MSARVAEGNELLIEDQRVVRAILVRMSLWDEPRPRLVTPGAAPRLPAELEYLPWVE